MFSENPSEDRADPQDGPYQLFVLVLCLLVLVQLAVEALFHVSPAAHEILLRVDLFICFFFFIDFCIQFKKAPSKFHYMVTWGWIDLLSSIPLMSLVLWGRAARALRLLKILRGIRSARDLVHYLASQRRAESAFLSLVLIAMVVITTSSIVMAQVEGGKGGSINTAADALWWAVVTISTVGYGDTVPMSPEGRIVAVCLMAVGIGLFGTFTALVASWFEAPIEAEQEREMEAIRKEVQEIRRLLTQHLGVPHVDLEGPDDPEGGPSDGVPGAPSLDSQRVSAARRMLEGSRR